MNPDVFMSSLSFKKETRRTASIELYGECDCYERAITSDGLEDDERRCIPVKSDGVCVESKCVLGDENAPLLFCKLSSLAESMRRRWDTTIMISIYCPSDSIHYSTS